MCVATRDERVTRRRQRTIESGGNTPLRVGDPAHLRKPHGEEIPCRRGLRAVGDDHTSRTPGVVLPQDGFERSGQGGLGVAGGHDDGHGREPGAAAGHGVPP